MRVSTLQFALTVGCLAGSWPTLAQAPEVVVEASHLESSAVKGSPGPSVVYRVSYADLDLATHSGAVELEKRIKDAATKACAHLQTLYATSVDPHRPCAADATRGAMAQASKAIAAAEKGAK